MTLGTGIFLSSILISMVILFGMTKDRWNWKKIFLLGVFLIITISLVAGIGVWGLYLYENRPVVQDEFLSLKLSHNSSDVKFIKGEPDVKLDSIWVYKDENDKDEHFAVKFEGDKIRAIIYGGDCTYCNNISERGIGDTYESVIERFGEPSNISISKDQLGRMLSFGKYQIFFRFSENKVNAFGVYNKEFGEMEFQEKANE